MANLTPAGSRNLLEGLELTASMQKVVSGISHLKHKQMVRFFLDGKVICLSHIHSKEGPLEFHFVPAAEGTTSPPEKGPSSHE